MIFYKEKFQVALKFWMAENQYFKMTSIPKLIHKFDEITVEKFCQDFHTI